MYARQNLSQKVNGFTVTYTGFRKMAEFKLVEESAFQPEAQCQEKHRGENQHGVLGKMDQ